MARPRPIGTGWTPGARPTSRRPAAPSGCGSNLSPTPASTTPTPATRSSPRCPATRTSRLRAVIRVPDGVRPEFACLYEVSLLSREQEAHQFRKMNCLKHLAEQARSRLGSGRSRRHDLEEFERLRNEAVAVKQQIIRANLRLVVSIARRFARRYGDFAELISVGNLALIRAVDKFDFARGHRFSTYATWAIRNEFRSVRRERRLVPTDTANLPDTVDMRDDPVEQQLAQDRRERIVAYLLGRLDERERRILVGRFGIGGAREETLGQLGAELGISKERVPPDRGAGPGPSPQVCPHGRASPLASLIPPARGHPHCSTPQPRPPTSERRPGQRASFHSRASMLTGGLFCLNQPWRFPA